MIFCLTPLSPLLRQAENSMKPLDLRPAEEDTSRVTTSLIDAVIGTSLTFQPGASPGRRKGLNYCSAGGCKLNQ